MATAGMRTSAAAAPWRSSTRSWTVIGRVAPPGRRSVASSAPESATMRRSVAARFQHERRPSIDEATRAGGFSDESTVMRKGPVLVAADCTHECARALQWALTHLCRPPAAPGDPAEQVELVHVVCDPRAMYASTSVGAMPSGAHQLVDDSPPMGRGAHAGEQEVEGYTGALLRRAQCTVEGTCGEVLRAFPHLPHQIHLPWLSSPRSASAIGEQLVSEAERLNARLLVVASHGPGALAEFGSVARWCFQHSPVPLVLVPSGGETPAPLPWRHRLHHQHLDADEQAVAVERAEAEEEAENEATLRDAAAWETPSSTEEEDKEAEQLRRQQEAAGAAAAAEAARRVVEEARPAYALDAQPTMPMGHPSVVGGAAAEGEGVGAGGGGGGGRAAQTVLLVVQHLPELEAHWQWVADNLVRRGDSLVIWHLQGCADHRPMPSSLASASASLSSVSGAPEPSPAPADDLSLASLPTALEMALKRRGVAEVRYEPMWVKRGPTEAANKVIEAALAPGGPGLVVVLNYERFSALREAVEGSVASVLARWCPVPLVLLQPAV